MIEAEGGKSARERFVEFYSKAYYYLNRDLPLEEKIQKILEKNSLEPKDFVDILRWKVGATSCDYEKQTVTNRWRTIEVGDVVKSFQGDKGKESDPVEILKTLLKKNGIGSVYAITFLYFLSKGKWPIYDKYAHMALKKIEGTKTGADFNSLFSDSEIGKELHADSASAKKIFEEYQACYVRRLNEIFGDEKQRFGRDCITDRSIDQALWVYGHLFNKIAKNKKRSKSPDEA